MNRKDKIVKFLREVRSEVKKVVFPTRKDTIATTWVVLGLVALIAFYLGVVDWMLSNLLYYFV